MRTRAAALAPTLLALLLAGAPIAAAEPRHGLAMHGAPKYGPAFAHFDYVNPQAPKGGELRLGASGTFDSFNPFIIKGNPAQGAAALPAPLGLLYDTLLEQSADEPFSMYGLLAASVDTPEDRSWVEFALRPEARWHDGRPVTADDVVWSFHTLFEKGAPAYRLYYAGVERVEKRGERAVRFSFKPGQNRELPLILGQLPVLPKHYWAGRDFEASSLEPPLGSGPYRIGRFEPGRYVVFERVPDYWGRDLPLNRGRYNFDALRFDYYRDDTVELEAFKGGEYDFRREMTARYWATAYEGMPELKSGLLVKERSPHQQSEGMQSFVLNHRREIFKERRVREALAYAFDFEWTNKNLQYGEYQRTRSYFENSELAARGLPGPAELAVLEPLRGRIPEEVFTREYEPPHSDGSGQIRENLRRAAELLDAAGWRVRGGRRVREADGMPLAFEILLDQPGFERIVLPFKKNLERLGVEASVRIVDDSQYRRRVDDFDFDVIIVRQGQSLSPGNEQREFWGSDAAGRRGSRNVYGIADPVIDELIELVVTAPDRESLVARTRALDRVLLWGHHVIPQYHMGADRLVYWSKFGKPDAVPMEGFQIDAWWVDSEQAARLEQRRGKGGGAARAAGSGRAEIAGARPAAP